MPLIQVQGDATQPPNLGIDPIIIPHVCNDIGGWGSGFVLAINNAFGMDAMDAYRQWHKDGIYQNQDPNVRVMNKKADNYFELGAVQLVKLPNKLVIANMIGQHGVRGMEVGNRPPIRYGALAACMTHVGELAKKANAKIHCPRFGSDLAGGNWEVILQMIQEIWVDKGIDVTVYEFVPKEK